MMIGIVAGVVTLVCSLGLPVLVRPVLERLGIVDIPNERSSHERPVLRGLGLAVLIAMAVGYVVFLAGTGWISVLSLVAAGAVVSGLVGLREDLRGLSVPVRSAVLLVIAVVVASLLFVMLDGYGGATIRWISTVAVDPVPIGARIALVVYAVLFLSSYINVANFMDGLNGISGFHGMIAGATFALAGWICGLDWLVAAGLILAAGFAGFLPWNLSRRGAFLGDVGSYLLGGATAITSFAALLGGVPFLATIGPMVIYFGDVGVTLVKRVRAGSKWYEPHKEHVYQRVQQLGYSHLQASLMVAGCSALSSILGLLSIGTGLWGSLALLVAGLAVLIWYLLLPRLLAPRAEHGTST